MGAAETDADSMPSEPEERVETSVETLSGTMVHQTVDVPDKSIFAQIVSFVVCHSSHKYFLITLLIATIPMFILHIFNDFNDFDDEFVMERKYRSFNAKYDVDVNKINPIQYCQQLHKSDGLFMEVNVKKCLVKTIQNKYKNKRNENSKFEIERLLAIWEKIVEKRNNDTGTDCGQSKKAIRAKEDYLKKKEQFLVEKEYELLKTELKYRKKADKSDNENGKVAEKKKLKKYKDERKKYDNFKVKNDTKTEEGKTKSKEKNDKVKHDKKARKYEEKGEEKVTKENRNYKSKYIKRDSDEKMDGSWHVRLHESRQNLRKKGQDSMCHKWKGLKPNWYLSLMKNRQYVRDKVKHIPRCI